MKDLQIYCKRVIVDVDSAESHLVTLVGVDLGEITSQVTVSELLDNLELFGICEYVISRVEDGEMDS